MRPMNASGSVCPVTGSSATRVPPFSDGTYSRTACDWSNVFGMKFDVRSAWSYWGCTQ
jgi:hypothetical protein